MPLTVAARNTAADAVGALVTHLSLHTADPGATGASEATGGTPAYARKPIVNTVAANGTESFAEVTFDVPTGTYTHFGAWSAATLGTFIGGNPLAASQAFTSQGQLKVTVTIPVTAT